MTKSYVGSDLVNETQRFPTVFKTFHLIELVLNELKQLLASLIVIGCHQWKIRAQGLSSLHGTKLYLKKRIKDIRSCVNWENNLIRIFHA